MPAVSGLVAFVDLDPLAWERGSSFWAQAVGAGLSPVRGADREFATLLPASGAPPRLKVQRLRQGPTRTHLDLHVPDPVAAAAAAEGLGAEVAWRSEDGYVVLRSPTGLPFCLVHEERLPVAGQDPVADDSGPRTAALAEVCLDVPAGRFEEELDFWSGLTGWAAAPTTVEEFWFLRVPEHVGLGLLLQRTQDDRAATTAHLDLDTTDRAAEVERHVALGATRVADHGRWTVLRDPAGSAYCLTDRDPGTEVLPAPPGP